MTAEPASDRSRVRRLPDRGHYDRSTVYGVLDAALFCHVAFVDEGRPFVIPMLFARVEDAILVHGASTSRLLRHIEAGNELSVNVVIIDGVVLAKTAFNQSVNYRSVVLFGAGRLVDNPAEKVEALARLTERLVPGQWEYARQPNGQELKATSIIEIGIAEASAKIRSGPPKDDGTDKDLPLWAGVVPIVHEYREPVPASYASTSEIPAHVTDFVARRRSV